MGFIVNSQGLLTLIQDKGRIGYQKFGVPSSGVMDNYSYEIGNILVGNNGNEACLEVLMMGPEIIFDDESKIAITGADLGPMINDIKIDMWRSYIVKRGDRLSFKGIFSGARSYICFEGGIDAKEVMNSKSTYTRARIGGIEGRPIKVNDYINLNKRNNYQNRILDLEYIPEYKSDITLRVIKGPQDDMFEDSEFEKLTTSEYIVTNECDRMGYRLEGEEIKHIQGADIISDGISFGAIQIPGHGKPIIMMADRQTVGGYSKIANVCTVDLPKLAQAKPGDKVKFEIISVESAQKELIDYCEKLEYIKDNIKTFNIKTSKMFTIKIGGKVYNTMVEEVI